MAYDSSDKTYNLKYSKITKDEYLTMRFNDQKIKLTQLPEPKYLVKETPKITQGTNENVESFKKRFKDTLERAQYILYSGQNDSNFGTNESSFNPILEQKETNLNQNEMNKSLENGAEYEFISFKDRDDNCYALITIDDDENANLHIFEHTCEMKKRPKKVNDEECKKIIEEAEMIRNEMKKEKIRKERNKMSEDESMEENSHMNSDFSDDSDDFNTSHSSSDTTLNSEDDEENSNDHDENQQQQQQQDGEMKNEEEKKKEEKKKNGQKGKTEKRDKRKNEKKPVNENDRQRKRKLKELRQTVLDVMNKNGGEMFFDELKIKAGLNNSLDEQGDVLYKIVDITCVDGKSICKLKAPKKRTKSKNNNQ